jgi:predicted acylesterase/phospholipase RssA
MATNPKLNVGDPPPRVLVFSGGGVQGFAFAGALEALHEAWGWDFGLRTPSLQSVAGVSAGALIALLIGLGYSLSELMQLVGALDTGRLFSPNPAMMLSGWRGFDGGDALRDLLASLIRAKVTSHAATTLTFSQLFDATGVRLCVGTVDVERCCVVYLGTETDPHVPVLNAVLASMALPPLFSPVRLDDGRLLADGGLLDNFPIHLFPSSAVMGFRVAATRGNEDTETAYGYMMRIARITTIPMDELQWACVPEAYKQRTVVFRIKEISATNFAIEQAAVQQIIRRGRDIMAAAVLAWKDGEKPADEEVGASTWVLGLPPILRRWFTPIQPRSSTL